MSFSNRFSASGLGHAIPLAILVSLTLMTAITLTSCDRPLTRAFAVVESLSIRHATDQSDFYSTVNRDWLLANPLPPKGYAYFSAFQETERKNNDALIAILDSLDPDSLPADSPERKVAILYRSYLDIETRNRQGAMPIRKYLERFDGAKTIKELMDVDLLCYRETGIACILGFNAGQNDAGVPMLIHYGPGPSYLDVYRGGKRQKAYIRYLEKLYVLAGYDARDAANRARKLFDFERSLSAYAQRSDKAGDPTSTITYPFYLFRTLYPAIDFRAHFEAMGFTVPEYILISNQRVMEEAAKAFTDAGKEPLALYAEKFFIEQCGQTLSTGFTDAFRELTVSLYGYSDNENAPDRLKRQALDAVRFALPSALGHVFVNRMVTDSTRADASSIVTRVVETYPAFIKRADWMDERTKERALAKLGALRRHVAYPDAFNRDYDDVALVAPSAGGTLFANGNALRLRFDELERAKIGKPVNRDEWPTYISVYVTNAFNHQNLNAIFVPAGFLRPPFYDPEKSESWNLGALGVVVAHEISHSFDTNGSKIDETGAARTWWVKGDYEKFASRCERVRAYYDKAKGAYGARDDGTLTLSENVSDIMGLQCALEVLKKTANPDYREFFTAFATCFRTAATPEAEYYFSKTNVHSLARARVNRAVANFQEFQDAFGVTKGDPLYVAPEDRVSVW